MQQLWQGERRHEVKFGWFDQPDAPWWGCGGASRPACRLKRPAYTLLQTAGTLAVGPHAAPTSPHCPPLSSAPPFPAIPRRRRTLARRPRRGGARAFWRRCAVHSAGGRVAAREGARCSAAGAPVLGPVVL
jgi:hypothetical protein